MSERRLRGYAVKLTSASGNVQWVVTYDGHAQYGKVARSTFSKSVAYSAASEALDRKNSCDGWDAKIVAIYSKPKRTAAEERARVVEYLKSGRLELTALEIEEGAHWKTDVQKPHVDTDAPQLEALGKAPACETLDGLKPGDRFVDFDGRRCVYVRNGRVEGIKVAQWEDGTEREYCGKVMTARGW